VGIGGKLIWKRDLELGGAWLTGSGVVVGNQLVVAAYFGTIMKRMVIAIDIDNGDLLWQRTLDKEPMCGPIADPAQKHLIVVTKDTSILVLDLQGNIQEVHEKVGCVGEPLVTEKGIVFAGKFGGLSTIKSVAK
jgi:outer membrane protein assembly factor BamB